MRTIPPQLISKTILLAIALTAGCATQRSAARSGPGPTVLLTVGGCRTVTEAPAPAKLAAGVAPLPDAQLCVDVKGALGVALPRAGYRPAAGSAGAPDLTAKLSITQRPRAENDGTDYAPKHRGVVSVAVNVSVSAKGRDLERFAGTAELAEAPQVQAQLAETADKLVADLLASPPVQEAGLAPGS